MNSNNPSISMGSRRQFLGMVGGAAALAGSAALLSACSQSASTTAPSPGTLKFWDMAWGIKAYGDLGTKITAAYAPAAGLPTATYQSTQWVNYYQTFTSAIASNTGPAVSTGAGYQALQFTQQGAIAPADNLVAKLKKSGKADDFLEGTIDALKYKGSYVAVPWQMDIRVLWYRPSLLEKAGAEIPTDWDGVLAAGKALKKIGVSGFGVAGGENLGPQQFWSFIINNGGGFFDKDGNLDVVTDRNIETVTFLKQLVAEGIIDPTYTSYTSDNLYNDMVSGKVGMAVAPPGMNAYFTGANSADIVPTSPLSGPHGDKGTLYWVNNIMMYKNTPSQEGSEAFIEYYLDQIKGYWQNNLITSLPVLKSIVKLPEFQANKNNVKIIEEWQPIGQTAGATGSILFPALAAVEGSQAVTNWAQAIIQAKSDPKKILEDLQAGLQPVIKS